jgi:hypothetical protein
LPIIGNIRKPWWWFCTASGESYITIECLPGGAMRRSGASGLPGGLSFRSRAGSLRRWRETQSIVSVSLLPWAPRMTGATTTAKIAGKGCQVAAADASALAVASVGIARRRSDRRTRWPLASTILR